MGKLEKGDGVNWDAASHQQLWEWFSQPRLVELEGWMDSLTHKVAAHFQAAADKVDQALRAAGVHWEGAAADAMKDASTPLAEHALRAKDAATQAGMATLGQFMHAKNMATAIPEPLPAPNQNIFLEAQAGNIAQYFQDVAAQEAAANEADARARDLARSYDAAADDAAGSLPRFEPAPAATVSRAEPGDVIKVDGSDPGPGPRRDTGPVSPGPGDPGPDSSGPGSPGSSGPGQSGGPSGPSDQPGAENSEESTSEQSTSEQSSPPGRGPAGGAPLGPAAPGPADPQRPTVAAPLTTPVTPGPGGLPRLGGPGAGSPGGPGPGGQGARPGQLPPGSGTGLRGTTTSEGVVAPRTGTTATGRGSMGLAPVGAARGRDDEDTERTTPEYLHDFHDDFWDDTPPVAPPVIGDEDDD